MNEYGNSANNRTREMQFRSFEHNSAGTVEVSGMFAIHDKSFDGTAPSDIVKRFLSLQGQKLGKCIMSVC